VMVNLTERALVKKFGASIGFGGAGQGKTFEANYNSLQRYKLKMRVIKPHKAPKCLLQYLIRKLPYRSWGQHFGR